MLVPPGPRVTVVIQYIVRVSDGMGGFTNTWTTGDTLKGVLSPVNGVERIQYNKEVVIGDYIFYGKKGTYTPKEADRLTYGTRIFRILFVSTPFMNSKFFILELEEVK